MNRFKKEKEEKKNEKKDNTPDMPASPFLLYERKTQFNDVNDHERR